MYRICDCQYSLSKVLMSRFWVNFLTYLCCNFQVPEFSQRLYQWYLQQEGGSSQLQLLVHQVIQRGTESLHIAASDKPETFSSKTSSILLHVTFFSITLFLNSQLSGIFFPYYYLPVVNLTLWWSSEGSCELRQSGGNVRTGLPFYLKLLDITYINSVDIFSEDYFKMLFWNAGISLEHSPVPTPTVVVSLSPRKVVASEGENGERSD